MSGIRVRLRISAPVVIELEVSESSSEDASLTPLSASLQTLVAHLASAQPPAASSATAPPASMLPASAPPAAKPPPPLATLTGPLLRQRRHEADLTIDALANLSGVAPKTIRNIEAGRHYPSQLIQRRLCAVAVLNLCPAQPSD